MSEKGIKAGNAYVKASLDDSGIAAGLKRAQRKIKAFGAGLKSTGGAMLAGGLAVAGPLAAAVKQFGDYGDQIAKMAKKSGVGVASLSELKYVATQTGTNFESLGKSIFKMQRSIYDAGRGLSTQTDALKDLGLTYAELKDLSPEQQFKLLADRIGSLEDPTKKAAISMMLFGRSGTDLIPMMNLGAKGIDDLQKKARDLGLTMSEEDAKAAEDFTDALDSVIQSAKMAVFHVGAALAPTFTELSGDIIASVKSAAAWIKENKEMIISAATLAVKIVAVGTAFMALGAILTAISAHPILALATAAIVLASVLENLTNKTVELKNETQKQLAIADKQRDSDLKRMERLKTLGEKEKLNNVEMGEATKLISTLEGKYGDLGIKLDETTGKITGLTGAHEKLTEAMKKAATAEVTASLAEAKYNVDNLIDSRNNYDWLTANNSLDEHLEETTKKIDIAQLKVKALQMRFNALQGAGPANKEALTGSTSSDERSAAAEASKILQATEKAASAEKRLADIRADEARKKRTSYEQELFLIKKTADEKRKLLKILIAEATARGDVNKVKDLNTQLSRVTTEEINQVSSVYDADDKKFKAEAAAKRRELAEDDAAHQKQLDVEIARLKIEQIKDVSQRRRAALTLDKAEEIEAAKAAGQSMKTIAKIVEKYKLRGQLLDGINMPEIKTASRGTFSAMMTASLGGSSIDAIADATKKTAKNTKDLVNKTGLTFA